MFIVSSFLFLHRPQVVHTYTVTQLKKLFVFLCGTMSSSDPAPPPPLFLHHCISPCVCVYLKMEILPFSDELLCKTHNFVSLTALASLNVFKSCDSVSKCTFYKYPK